MGRGNREALESAYREARYSVTTATEAALGVRRDIAPGKVYIDTQVTPGQITEAAKQAIERAVNELIAVHIRAGDRDDAEIATRIREFVEARTAPLPSVPSGNVGLDQRNQAMARTDFERMRTIIGNRVKDLVAAALLKERADTTLFLRIQKWALNHPVVAVLSVAAFVVPGIWKVVEVVLAAVKLIRGR